MDNNNSSSGVGPLSVIFIVFLILRLTSVIDWSWWWISAPIWIGAVLRFIGEIIYIRSELNKHKMKDKYQHLARDIRETKFLIKLHEVMEKNESLSKLN
jgi:hypothetical protein